jgi:23S rRNA (adenine2503-C2)-methyltransferase
MVPRELLGLDHSEMQELMAAWGEPLYRADQLYHAVYAERLADPARISTFPKVLRERLANEAAIGWPAIQKQFLSVDGTRRYLLGLAGGETIEAVLMPEEDRDTICISTQAGCPLGCTFCLTALLGLKQNLSAGDIVGQVLLVCRENGLDTGEDARRPVNVVFMGMGEPLLNYDVVLRAVRLLADPRGIGLSTRRMTLSTAGIVPRIAQLGREPVRPKLAVSLNATTDEVRTRLMPLNKKWNIAALLEACRDFPLRPGERLTFEYVLLEGVNDTPADARRLLRLVNGLRAKVNLIAMNPGAELPYRTPSAERVLAFQRVLAGAGVTAFIRKPRGRDIFAACGQLKLSQ